MTEIVQFFTDYLSLATISWFELCVRLVLACALAMVFGLERDRKNKPINYRAYMVVSLTTCCIAILGLEIGYDFATDNGILSLDLGKIISGTLTGIGFLGAGAIIKLSDNRVIGTTTGASVWAAGGMGLVIGFGYYGIALVFFLIMLTILIIGGLCMKKFTNEDDQVVHDQQD